MGSTSQRHICYENKRSVINVDKLSKKDYVYSKSTLMILFNQSSISLLKKDIN